MMLKKRTSNWARLKLLLFVPVAVGTMYAFAQPEVKKTVEQVVKPESVVKDSLGQEDTWELLEQYFERKRKDVWGESEPAKMKERNVHQLFVNLNDQVMLDNEFGRTSDVGKNVDLLRGRLTSILKKDYEQAIRDKRPFSSVIMVRYDLGSKAGAMKSYLSTIKDVYHQLRQEVATGLGGASEEQLDKIFPILVQFMNPQRFGELSSKDRETPLPVEIHLYDTSGNNSVTLKNLSLNELEREIIAYKASAGIGFSVSLKVLPEMQVGMVGDVRETIKKAYSLKQ